MRDAVSKSILRLLHLSLLNSGKYAEARVASSEVMILVNRALKDTVELAESRHPGHIGIQLFRELSLDFETEIQFMQREMDKAEVLRECGVWDHTKS